MPIRDCPANKGPEWKVREDRMQLPNSQLSLLHLITCNDINDLKVRAQHHWRAGCSSGAEFIPRRWDLPRDWVHVCWQFGISHVQMDMMLWPQREPLSALPDTQTYFCSGPCSMDSDKPERFSTCWLQWENTFIFWFTIGKKNKRSLPLCKEPLVKHSVF